MIDNETIDSYLIKMDLPAETLGEGMWRIEDSDRGFAPLVIRHDPPIVYLRMKVMDVPEGHTESLFRKLLEFNASGIAYGAYALEGKQVLLIDTLNAETLDLPELQSSIESLTLAASEHIRQLYDLVRGKE